MTPKLTLLALLVTLPTGAALADADCRAPMNTWQPPAAVMQLAAQNGWSVKKIKVDDGCLEIEGRDSAGRRIEVELDPATLRILEIDFEDDDDDDRDHGDRRRNPAPAGSVAPPQNGLFGTGAAPSVQVN